MASETDDGIRKHLDLAPLQTMCQPVIFVIGSPGAGKATQCIRLAEEFNLHHISMGHCIKDQFKTSQTPQANMLQQMYDSGGILPLEDVMHIVLSRMLELLAIEHKPFIIHGFPRYIFQATEYEHSVGFPRTVIMLECDGAITRDRLEARGHTSRRPDDQPAFVDERIRKYQATIQEVIDYYGPHNKLYIVDANQSIDDVYNDMAQVIELWT